MEDYVTYEQAVKFKELGFDWEVNHYYENNSLIESSYEVSMGMVANVLISINTLTENFNCNNDKIYSAPTLSQAAKWLRNKWNFLISIGYYSNEDENPNKRYYWDYFIKEMLNPFMVDTHYNEFDTYESALSAGIDAVLKLIEEKWKQEI